MRARCSLGVGLAWFACWACGGPPAASTGATVAPAATPTTTEPAPAASVNATPPGPSATPPFSAAPPAVTGVPLAPTGDEALATLWPIVTEQLQGAVHAAWSQGGELFLLSERTRPAHEHRGVLGYPPAAQQAAAEGRVVGFAEVHVVRAGELQRVFQKPIRVRPMVCDFEPEACDVVALTAKINERNGQLELGAGSCDKALAARSPKASNTYDAFDNAVVPIACRSVGRYAWNGREFAAASAASSTTSPIMVQEVEVEAALRTAMFPASVSQRPVQTFTAAAGRPMFVAVTLDVPAHHTPLLTHAPRTLAWESDRSLTVLEVWTTGPLGLRRVLQLPVGYAALGEGVVELEVPVVVDAAAVRVGNPKDTCVGKNTAAKTGIDKELDQDLTRRICSGRGTYTFDGRRFGKIP